MHQCMVYDVTVDGSGENSVDSAKFSGLIWFIKRLGFTRVVLVMVMVVSLWQCKINSLPDTLRNMILQIVK